MTSSFLKKLVAVLAITLTGLATASAQFTTQAIPGGVRITGYTGTVPANLVIPLQIGGTVLEIGTGAFQNQDTITTLTLPTSLTTIGANAFRDCDNLGSVFIPASVTGNGIDPGIGVGAFAACDRLASIEVDITNAAYASEDGVLYDLVTSAGNAILLQYPAGRPGNSYSIPIALATAEPVISIASRAFEQVQNLLSMEFANSVASIGADAFRSAPRLARVTFDTQVTSIGASSFNGTGSLAFATFLGNAPATLGADIFGNLPPSGFEVRYVQGVAGFNAPTWTPANNPEYKSRIIQTNGQFTYRVEGTGVVILSPETGLPPSAVIPSTIAGLPVRAIGAASFIGASSLNTIQFPETLNRIETSAFEGCEALSFVTIPASVSDIGKGAFAGCTGLFFFDVSSLNQHFSSPGGVLFNKNQTILYSYPANAFSTQYFPPSTTITIFERAFEESRNLVTITFPDSVTTIGNRAFYNSRRLVTAYFGNKVANIGDDAFSGIFSILNTVYFYGNAPTLGSNAFPQPPQPFEVLYLEGAQGFPPSPGGAWNGYAAKPFDEFEDFLFSVLPNDTIEIKGYNGVPPSNTSPPRVRINFTSLPPANRVVPDQAARLALTAAEVDQGEYVLQSDTATLWTVSNIVDATDTQPARVEWAVVQTDGAQLGLGDWIALGTTIIVQNASGPIVYQKVAFPGTNPGDWIAVNFGIPDTIAGKPVTSIADGAFTGTQIMSMVLPTSLLKIGADAFADCGLLGFLGGGVYIPASVTEIGDGAFSSCGLLGNLFANPSSPKFFTRDGVLFNKDQTTLLCYPAGRAQPTYQIPATVFEIGNQAFEGNRYLVTLDVPDSVETIGTRAFAESDSLVQVTIGKNIKTIRDDAFRDVLVLSSAIFNGNAPTTLGTGIFDGTAPDFLIEYYLGFTGFNQFVALGYNISTLNKFEDFLFEIETVGGQQVSTIKRYVGVGGIVRIPSVIGQLPVRAIQDNAFLGKDGITQVLFPSGVTSIGVDSFRNISSLASVEFGTGLVSIAEDAFFNCDALTAISLPAGVTDIGLGAFGSCDGLTSITVSAANPKYSSLNGVLYDKIQSKVIQYPGGLPGESLVFPVTVTTIGERAFEENGNLVSLEFPSTVTTVERQAFLGSSALAIVRLGNRVEILDDEAFAKIPVLDSAIFLGNAPAEANFGADVFAGASPSFKVRYFQGAQGFPTVSPSTWSISGQSYPTEFIASQSEFTFSVANNQVTITGYQGAGGFITIPTSIGGFPVRAIGNSAFEGNEFISFVTIPSTVTSIGNQAFFGNTSLRFIQIPASVIFIGDQAFGGSTELSFIDVSPSNTNYSSNGGVLFDKNQKKLILYPMGGLVSTYTIPTTVTEIGDRAFEGNRNLVTLDIPNGVVRIGDRAFYNSESLVTIRFGTGIDFIGADAFSGPFSVLNAAYFFGKTPTTVQANAFPQSPSVFEVRYLSGSFGFPANPLGGPWNGYNAVPFSEFGNFLFTVLQNNTIEITGYTGTAPSRGAPPQVRVDFTTLPDRDRTVPDQSARLALTASQVDEGEYVYQSDTATLWTVSNIVDATENQPARVEWAVVQTDGEQLRIDPLLALGSTVIVQNATGPIVWQKVAFPGSNPSDWISVNFGIPDTIAGKPVTKIANGAFAGNDLLTSVVLPTSLTHIGANAFYDCDSLGVLGSFTGVYIPASVSSIGDGAFASCSRLDSLFVHPSSPKFFTRDGVLFNKDQTTLLCYPSGRYQAIYEVPQTLTAIGAQAFEGNRYLVTIELPDSVKTIGQRAFAESESLVQVTFGKDVESLGDEAFKDVLVLGSAIFNGNAPKVIGNRVFDGAADGFEINYFQGFTGFGAFQAMGYTIATLNKVGDFLFTVKGTSPNETAEVTGYVGTGGNVTIPSVIGQLAVRSIGERAFLGKTNVARVTIPNSVTEIKERAFFGATNMESVVFGSGLTRIYTEAFMNCDSLLTVHIPASVTEFGNSVFSSCDSLSEITVALDNPKYSSRNGVLFDKTQQTLVQYPSGLAVTSYEIPGSVSTIGSRAFEGNVNLALLEIPNSVTTIEDRAFYDALALVSIRFGRNVNTIGDEAFAGVAMPLVSAVFFGNAPAYIDSNIFGGAFSTFKVSYVKGAQNFNIVDNEWIVPGNPPYPIEEISTLDDFQFEVVDNKIRITGYTGLAPKIEANVSTLPQPNYTVANEAQRFALEDDPNVVTGSLVYQEDNGILYEIFRFATSWSIYTTTGDRLDLPSSLAVGTTVLEQNTTGKVVYQKIAQPGDEEDDWIVVNFNIPETLAGLPVTEIAPRAFKNNTVINSVVFPNSLTTIGEGAFEGCNLLTSVFLPASLESYGNGAFASCSRLTRLIVSPFNPKFSNLGSVLFNKSQSELWQFPAGFAISTYTVPSTVTQIMPRAFEGNVYLSAVEIPNSVTSIGSQAFLGSKALVRATMGTGLLSIGSQAFASIAPLQSATFYGNAPSLENQVFQGNSNAFRVYYLPGRTGYDAIAWQSFTPTVLNVINDFEFTVTNNKAQIERYVGTSPTIIPNLVLSGTPSLTVSNSFFRLFLPTTLPVGSIVLQTDTDTLYQKVANPGSSEADWRVLTPQTVSSRTDLPATLPLGTTVQELSTNAVYQKIASPGTNASDWIIVNFEIPATLGSFPVTSIAAGAFEGNTVIDSVVFPNSLTAIGAGAFAEVNRLRNVFVPAGVTSIEPGAFAACDKLESITVHPSNLAYESADGVLFKKGQQELVQYPAGRLNSSYAIPATVKTVSALAFEGNRNLVLLTIPNSVESIGFQAFYNSASLSQVVIGTGVASIGEEAFAQSVALGKLTFLRFSAPVLLGNNVFLGVPSDLIVQYFEGSTGFNSSPWTSFVLTVVLPATPTGFTYKELGGTIEVTGFIGEDTLSTINEYLIVPGQSPNFVVPTAEARRDLWRADLPNGTLVLQTNTNTLYQKIAGSGLRESDWEEVTAQGTLDSLNSNLALGTVAFIGSDNSFYQKVSNTGVAANDWIQVDFQVPSQINGMPVVSIAESAFEGNSKITSVALPNSLTRIGEKAFYKTNLQGAVFIPASVSSIGLQAFANVGQSFTSFFVHPNNLNLSSNSGVLFNKGQTQLIQYPEGRIDSAYTIPATVTAIGERAFEANSNLVSLTIPNGVTTIGAGAFYGGSSLTQVVIGTGVTNIGNEAFAENAALGSATFLRLTAPTMGTNVFAINGAAPSGFVVRYIQGATGYEIPPQGQTLGSWKPEGNPVYATNYLQVNEGGMEFKIENEAAVVTGYSGTNSTVVIPETLAGKPVRSIQASAFANNLFITSMSLPNTLNIIGENAFAGAANLESITFGGGLTTIGAGAFRGATGLKLIKIPASVTSIGAGAFAGCSSLASIEVDPANQKYSSTFSFISGSSVSQGSGVLFNKNLTELILYPMAKGGSEFIVPGTVQIIWPNAFEGNLNLVSVEFPDNVLTVGDRAFYNSESLVSLRFGTRLNLLGSESFAGIRTLSQAIFLGNAPEGNANVFLGANPDFQILYLNGKNGFVGGSAKSWLVGYTRLPFQQDKNFEFTTANGTVEITKFIGVPPLANQPPQVKADIDTRPQPKLVVPNDQALRALTVSQITFGESVLQADIDQLWIAEELRDSENRVIGINWVSFENNGDYLAQPTSVAPGTTVLEQNSSGPVIYQKVSGNGTSPSDWIQVNFEIPKTIAGLPVTSIAAGAFANNKLLQSVVIPSSVTKIGANAFYNCDLLGSLGSRGANDPKGVFIPAAVSQIGVAAFARCRSLENLYVHSSNPIYKSQEGILYNFTQTELLQYPAGKLGVRFLTPSSVRSIRESAFEGNRYLAILETANNLNSIGARAFFGCEALVQARFGTGLNSLGNSSFSSIPSLGSVVFNGNWSGNFTFGSEVFAGASDTFEVNYFPGATGFDSPDWTPVPGQTYKADTVNFFGDFEFTSANGAATITGYRGTGGNVIMPSTLLGNPVRAIGDLVFAGNEDITEVRIANSMTAIGNRTFAGAENLATVELGTGLVSIGEEAFSDCDALTTISLPAGVASIGLGAFGSCDNLATIPVSMDNPVYSSLDGVLLDKLQARLVQYPGGKTGAYQIPATVSTIGQQAFKDNATLASLKFPDTVRTIEAGAFEGSLLLYEATFGTGIQTIAAKAFANISSLNLATFLRLTAPDLAAGAFDNAAPDFTVFYMPGATGYTTGNWTAYNPTMITTSEQFQFVSTNGSVTITAYTGTNATVEIPSSIGGAIVRAIASNVFKGNLVITSVTIPSSVSIIGSEAFAGTENLTSITLGTGLTTIGANAFRGSGLTSIDLPAGVTSIGAGAFAECFNLEAINVNDSNPAFSSSYSVLSGSTVTTGSGVLFNKNRTELILYPMAKGGSEFIVPGTVRTIRANAFEGNLNLVTVDFPDNVEQVLEKAFYGSQSLVSLRFGAGLKVLGSESFASIPALNQAVFLGDAPDGSDNVFAGASSSFRILYLGGRSGFVGPGAKTWLAGYNLQPFQDDGVFEFTSVNGTVEITRFTGVPPLPGQPPQVEADFDARPLPQKIVENTAERLSLSFTDGLPVGAYVLQEDTNTIWIVGGYLANNSVDWEVYESFDARLELPNSTSLGATILEQNQTGPVVYQKIANPGFNPEDWIQVNFEIPSTIAGLPVTSIGTAAFANNKLLQSVVIPPSVTKIGENAFLNCEQLGRLGLLTEPKGVFIPAAVNQIGTGAFGRCRSLENLFVHTSNPVFTSQAGVLYTKNLAELRQYPVGKLGIEFTTPANVRTITERAFEGNRFLALVTLSQGVDTIGKRAFYGSQALAQARLGAGVKNVGDEAFAAIPSLGSAVFAGNAPVPPVGSFGANVFAGASDNFEVNYFVGATGYNIVDGEWIVADNPPYPIDVVNVAGDYEFKIENGVVVITGYLGNGGAIEIPASLGNLPVRVIGTAAFAFNQSITSVVIPNSVAKIENSAFAGMDELVSVQFGIGLVSIGEDAFLGCSKLPEVTLPAGVIEIGAGAFGVCESLQSITVNAANPSFRSTGGVLFDKSQQTLLQYPGGLSGELYTIPATVKAIGPRAFEQNGNLIAMDIPNGVNAIGARAFYRAFGISRVLIGSGVTAIGAEAFADIAVLSTVTFQGDAPAAQNMGADLFVGASLGFLVRYYEGATGFTTPEWQPNTDNLPYPTLPLTSEGDFEFTIDANREATITGYIGLGGPVEIPASIGGFPVRAIAPGAFENNTIITSVVFPNSVTTIGASAFQNMPNLQTVEFGGGLKTIGYQAFYRCDSLFFVSLPASVTSIGEAAFGRCLNLFSIGVSASNPTYKSVAGILLNKAGTIVLQYPSGSFSASLLSLPTTVVEIGKRAFEGNTALVTLPLPGQVTTIRERAFYQSERLVSVTFGTGLTRLESEAFAGIASLDSATFLGDSPAFLGTNVFGPPPATGFQVRYVQGKAGFPAQSPGIWPNPPNGYTAVALTTIDDFEFEVVGGTITITGYTGIPGRVRDYVIPTSLEPQEIVANRAARDAISTTNEIGYKVLQRDNDTVYVLKEVRAATENNPAQNVWEILVVDNYLASSPSLPLSTIYKQQDSNGPLFYQKVASPGNRPTDWIKVSNFTLVIPETLAGLPVTAIAGRTGARSGAFEGNFNIGSVKFPNTLKTIGSYAFANCRNLGSPDGWLGSDRGIFIPANVETIGDGAFAYCTDLTQFIVHPSNRNFTSVGGVLYSKDLGVLVQYPAGNFATSFTTSARTQRIAPGAFEGDGYLESVLLSDSVREIDIRAFYAAESLVSVSIGTGIRTIQNEAFAAIPSLALATFSGNAPTSIAANTFLGAALDFQVQYTAGKSGFDRTKAPWNSLNLVPIWPEQPSLSPSSGFRAIGIVAPAGFNGNIGGQISLAVSRSRVVTGTLTMGEMPKGSIATFRFSGLLSEEGEMTISIPRRAKSTLTLNLELDMANAPSYFKFNSSSQLDDGTEVAFVAAAIVPWSTTFPATLYGGQYNVALQSDPDRAGEVDPGYGFLTMTINRGTGAVRAAGVLADGTKVTSSTMLLGRDSEALDASNAIPLWIPLYRNHGMLLGDLFLQVGLPGKPVTSELLWTKPPGVPRSTNFAGFNDVPLTAELGSGFYDVPAASRFNNLTLTFDDGVPPPILATFVESKGRIRPNKAATDTYNMKAAWNLRGGFFQGTFTPSTSDRRLTRYQGIILHNLNAGTFKVLGNLQMPNVSPDKESSFFQGGSVSNN